MKSVPHRCESCVAEQSYFGQLVFGGAKPPLCRTHGTQITPVVRTHDLRYLPLKQAINEAFRIIRAGVA